MEISGKVAIVTGGASGLGRATCEQLVGKGGRVVIFDLNEELAQQAVQELGKDNASYAVVNVSDEASVAAGIEHAVNTFGAIHICVNCAGIATGGKILDREANALPLAEFSKTIGINLLGTFNVARLAAEQMAKNEVLNDNGERGLIVNTASVAAYDGQMGQCAYAASKGGIVSMTLPLARDLAKTGVRVNAVAPGIMGTPMLMGLPQNVQDTLVKDIQFPKRLGLPSEFGDLICHMAENAYLNGEVVRLDGAIRMPPR